MSRRGLRTGMAPELATQVRSYGVLAARLIVAGVFLYAAFPKIIDPAAFAGDIANYRVPHWMWNASAAVVPILELFGALLLLHPRRWRAGALILGALTLVFLVLIYSVIARDIDIACGCFGQGEEASRVGWDLFVRDLGLLALVGVAYLPRRSQKAPAVAAQPSQASEF